MAAFDSMTVSYFFPDEKILRDFYSQNGDKT